MQWGIGVKQIIMLQHITWQQFLIALLVIAVIWYVTVILLFYRKELKRILSGRPIGEKSENPLQHRWEQEFDPMEQEAEDHLMGKSKLPEGVSVIDAEQIRFADDLKQQKLGLIPDVIEEIKIVFQMLPAEDGDKQDFFVLMNDVKEAYPKISSHPGLPQINDFIIENAPFLITKQELENLW